MAAPIVGEFTYAHRQNLDGIDYDVLKSPVGYVVPFAQFEAFLHRSINRYKDHNDALTEMSEGTKTATSQFEETVNYIENRFSRTAKNITEELKKYQFGCIALGVIVAALIIVLLIVLI